MNNKPLLKIPTHLIVNQNIVNGKSKNTLMQSSELINLFEDELKEIYWAEKALSKAIPKMIKIATSKTLIEALQKQLIETEYQIERVEKIFLSLDKKIATNKRENISGLIDIAEDKSEMTTSKINSIWDAQLFSAGNVKQDDMTT